MENLTQCLKCGTPLQIRHTGRPRKFCSDACRAAHHARSARKPRRDSTPPAPAGTREGLLVDEFFYCHPSYDIRGVLGAAHDSVQRWHELRTAEYRRAIAAGAPQKVGGWRQHGDPDRAA